MTHPVGYFTSYDPIDGTPAVLDILQDRFGSHLGQISITNKYKLLAVISHCLATITIDNPDGNAEYSLEHAWADLGYEFPAELGAMINPLDSLDECDLRGLCIALLDNLHLTEVTD